METHIGSSSIDPILTPYPTTTIHHPLPNESYPFFLKLLYIWVKKSFKPSLVLILPIKPKPFHDFISCEKSIGLSPVKQKCKTSYYSFPLTPQILLPYLLELLFKHEMSLVTPFKTNHFIHITSIT
ncbi:hypothetical protein CFP56_020179 [Quercus suber]|uniref:Uncharacterized protein n=1 Tax=Quercus suber TaxID=58331 RepID=A0AAW0KG92_QUESU